MRGRLLVDGFVAAAVPVEGARQMGADVVIAVFLEAESAGEAADCDRRDRAFVFHRAAAGGPGMAGEGGVVIMPKVREFAWDDFAETPQMVAAGEEAAALEALPRINEALRLAARTRMRRPTERRRRMRSARR